MFDEKFVRKYGPELDSIVEEILDEAGTYDAHWDVLLAAARLIKKERDNEEHHAS